MNKLAAIVGGIGVVIALAGCGIQKGEYRHTDSLPTPAASIDAPTPTPVRAPEVSAGWADDNAQYNYYLNYLDQFAGTAALKLDVRGRIVFTVLDGQGRSVPNCRVTVTADGKAVCQRTTFADGRAMFFPDADGGGKGKLKVVAECGQKTVARDLDRGGPSEIELRLPMERPRPDRVPLDVAFIIDTTGSMGDEIDKLKQTLSAIHYQVTQMRPQPDVRFGMVLYRDRGDAYLTRVTPFTGDVKKFSEELNAVGAGGGGDNPEDVQEALRVTIQDLKWRPEAIRLAFLLADAPPHLDYQEPFTYCDFMREAAARGIKTTAIGAKGLNAAGEYVFRQLAQYTMGLFVFLTYGEKGETSGESPWTVSHHTGDNFETRNLDAIIVRSISRELSCLSDKPIEVAEDYFEARPAEGAKDEQVLDKLFAECSRQLIDFAQIKIEKGTPTAVVPVVAEAGCPAGWGDALTDHLTLALGKIESFKLVEREGLKQIMAELDLSDMLSFDRKPTTQPARHIAAELLVLSKVRRSGDRYEMFVKTVQVSTGQVVSATMLKIDPRLAE